MFFAFVQLHALEIGENSETISSSTSLSDSKELGEKKIHEDITFELSQIENAGRRTVPVIP